MNKPIAHYRAIAETKAAQNYFGDWNDPITKESLIGMLDNRLYMAGLETGGLTIRFHSANKVSVNQYGKPLVTFSYMRALRCILETGVIVEYFDKEELTEMGFFLIAAARAAN